MSTDPEAAATTAPPEPPRSGPARYLLPRSWIGRVVLAWFTGFVLMVAARAILGDDERSYTPIAYWTLIVILGAFIVSDGLRAWRRRREARGETQA